MVQLAGLRRKHAEFMSSLDGLRRTADDMEAGSSLDLWDRLTGSVSFLTQDLLPFTYVEDEILYPALVAAAETSTPIDILRAHQLTLAQLTDELDAVRRALPMGCDKSTWAKLRRILYSLYAIGRLHFTVEDDVVLPLLESDLDDHEAEQIEAAIRAVAHNLVLSLAYG